MLARFCYNRPMIEIFDTHTHLNVDNFAGKEQEEIDFAAELGVVKMNMINYIVRLDGILRKQGPILRKLRI